MKTVTPVASAGPAIHWIAAAVSTREAWTKFVKRSHARFLGRA